MCNYSAIFICWWIWGHISGWQSLPTIAWLWPGVNYIDKINILYSILQHSYFRLWNYSAVFIFWWIQGHFSQWQSLPVNAGLWLVHVIVMVICPTDQDSQWWKMKTVQSSKQWCDSDLHSYLTFSSDCLNMSHGVSGRYYLRVVILTWSRLSGVSYVDRSR